MTDVVQAPTCHYSVSSPKVEEQNDESASLFGQDGAVAEKDRYDAQEKRYACRRRPSVQEGDTWPCEKRRKTSAEYRPYE